MIEKIPFLHRGTTYNIIIKEDISFEALHYLLDYLKEKGAFDSEEGVVDKYMIEHCAQKYTLCVDMSDVFIVVE